MSGPNEELFLSDLPTPRQEQFRMRRLQVFNWGTFSGLHDIPIAERGFLFVGRSGSGKSTLLDAISALLVPPALVDFNAAARDAVRRGRDRSLMSYLRGAWAEQHDDASGEVTTRHLREGSTWAAMALEYRNALGRSITLVRLLWVRGNGHGADQVRKHFFIAERAFDLAELEGFDMDLRRLKHRLDDVHHHTSFNAYAERFRRLLGIDSEQALRLLHKTQSAKNLGDLNAFLRDFMLDKPETFAVADRLVREFGELDEAHKAVITARRQIDTLVPARRAHEELETLQTRQAELDGLLGSIDAWGEHRRLGLLEARLKALATRDEGLAGEETSLHEAWVAEEQQRDALRAQHHEQGGAQITQLEERQQRLQREHEDRVRRRGAADHAARTLDLELADNPHAFAAQRARAREQLESAQARQEEADNQRLACAMDKREAEKAFAEARREITALEANRSAIPSGLQALRARLCQALNLAESALPFVGELIEVAEDQQAWRGAIERVLHGFALSLLVDPRHHARVAEWVNATHLGGKLVYYRIDDSHPTSAAAPPRSLVHKLELADHPWRDWLRHQLQQRFDYACLDSVQALRQARRGLTREGQVKHGPNRYEKDDRHGIDDRRRWVLGFDNKDKLALYKTEAAELAARITAADEKLRAIDGERHTRARQAQAAQALVNVAWNDIDVAAVLDELDGVRKHLTELREGNRNLQELGRQIEAAEKAVRQARVALDHVRDQRRDARRERTAREKEHKACREAVAASHLGETESRALDERAAALPGKLKLNNLDDHLRKLERILNRERSDTDKAMHEASQRIVRCFEAFCRHWPADAGDVEPDLASAADFLARLKRLERDGLPRHEARFFEMLRTQSGQNLVALQTHIQQAHKAIRARMEDVNAGLEQVPFNPGSILQIRPEDRRLAEVVEFRQQLRDILAEQHSDDRDEAEARFDRLRALVARLDSAEAEDQRWRTRVLDVRLHVEFIGEELASEDRCLVDVHRSGAGRSGGQRQKLATACLAAALRYQLGDEDGDVPQYAAVVMDEAFDKADNEFTTTAMKIFENYGFQMIVATPLKSVMTLEPFIGGACFVDISERHDSSTLMIEYDNEKQRLNLPQRQAAQHDA